MPHPSPTRARATEAAGEYLLASAIVRQAFVDLRASSDEVRAEARRFWRTPQAVGFWADALDVDPDRLRRAALSRLAAHGRTES